MSTSIQWHTLDVNKLHTLYKIINYFFNIFQPFTFEFEMMADRTEYGRDRVSYEFTMYCLDNFQQQGVL